MSPHESSRGNLPGRARSDVAARVRHAPRPGRRHRGRRTAALSAVMADADRRTFARKEASTEKAPVCP